MCEAHYNIEFCVSRDFHRHTYIQEVQSHDEVTLG